MKTSSLLVAVFASMLLALIIPSVAFAGCNGCGNGNGNGNTGPILGNGNGNANTGGNNGNHNGKGLGGANNGNGNSNSIFGFGNGYNGNLQGNFNLPQIVISEINGESLGSPFFIYH
jgi:hypothetical protein